MVITFSEDLGFIVLGLRFQVSGFRFQVPGSRFQVPDFRSQVSGLRFKAQQDSGFHTFSTKVSGSSGSKNSFIQKMV
jgi:hypothetical protein